jgi:hypothetical protein
MDKKLKKLFNAAIQDAINEGIISVTMNDAGEKMIKILVTKEELQKKVDELTKERK